MSVTHRVLFIGGPNHGKKMSFDKEPPRTLVYNEVVLPAFSTNPNDKIVVNDERYRRVVVHELKNAFCYVYESNYGEAIQLIYDSVNRTM